MERWIECSAAEQRILEALWVRGSGTAADLAAAADVGERLASVCLTRLEQKGAVQRIERENGVVYAPHVQRVEVRAAKPVRPAKGGLLCLALPMGGGAKALKARFSLVAKRPAMKCATAAALAVCYPGLPCGCHRQKRRRSLPGLWPLGGRAGNGFDAGGRLCFNPWENAGKLSAYAPLGRPAGGGKKRWDVAGLFWRKCHWRRGFWYADHCGNDNWELPRRCVSLQRRWNGGQPHKL